MKILISVSRLTGGGAERVAASWANGLTRLGHEVTVISDFTQPVTYELLPAVRRVQSPRGTGPGPLRALTRRMAYFRTLRREAREADALVNVLYIYPAITLAALRTLRHRPLLVNTDHNAYERLPERPMRRSEYRHKFVYNKFADLITVLTDVDREIMLRRGFRQTEVLHNPLFLKPVDTVGAKEKTVLAVGRIDAWWTKGFDLLAEAWKRVGAEHPDWTLRIVGAGSEADNDMLRRICPLPNFEIRPYTADIAREYGHAAISVLASRCEGWGLVLVEAMSQGCAALACNSGGRQAEIITDGKNGLLCERCSGDALAEGMECLIADAPLRRSLQQAAPAAVAQYNEDDTALRLLDLLKQYKAKK